MTSNSRHYAILGLSRDCSEADAKRAYHARAKQYHPDVARNGDHHRRQLAMIRINEAYVAVLADLAAGEATRSGNQADPTSAFFSRWSQRAQAGPIATTRAVGSLRDPAYVYYKAGFRAYNEGSTMLYRKEGRELRRFLQTGGTFDAYVLGLVLQALQQFEQSYRYFLVVVEQHPNSPWYADARWKLYRLERYNAIYQRICENLSRRSSTRRSSFSMVAGAEPS